MKDFRFFSSFFILGLVSIISQVLILREIMVTFYGNELFLGLTLGFWLLWTALGSFWGKKFINRKVFLVNLVLLAFLFPLSLIFIRLLKILFPPGIMINFLKAISLTFVCLAPLGFSLGFFFTTAFAFFKTKKLSQITSQAYLIETLGLAAGGLFLNFWLIQLSPLSLSLFLGLIVLILALPYLKRKVLLTIPFLIICFALFKFPVLEQKTITLQFPGLVKSQNSIYGRITVTQKDNQYHFFESGTLTAISQKTEETEYLIHPVLLEHPAPKKILMIGGGLDGGLGEILKHQPEKVSYVELDPILVAVIKEYLAPQLVKVLEDKRINLVLEDPRKFLKQEKERYDVIIVNLPSPSTALINRLYTQEAMREIKQLLNFNGILALNLPLPTNYLSPEAKNLAISINQTIKEEFDQIILLPENGLLFLASNQSILTTDPQILIQRLEGRQIKTDFLSPAYLENRLTDDRIKMFAQELEKKGQINTDFFPIAYFYQTAFWQGYSSTKLANLFLQLPAIGLPFLAIVFIILLVLLFKKPRVLPHFILALSGATIMVWEIILIFAFQVKLGYIYHQISLILALALLGMALGNYWAKNYLYFKKHFKIIILLMILFTLTLPLILEKINQPINFFFLTATAGFLTGTMFPLVMQGYLKKQKQIGAFYAADLLGSFVGAILVSLFLLPVFGLQTAAYLLVIPFIFLLLQKLGP